MPSSGFWSASMSSRRVRPTRPPRAAGSYLPVIDPDFDEVTDDLIRNVKSWLDFPWTTAITQQDRDAFRAVYAQPPQPQRKRRRRRS